MQIIGNYCKQTWIWPEKKKTHTQKRKRQEIQQNVGHSKQIDKNMRSLLKMLLNVGFCCFVCLCIFCVLFETVCHFDVLQVHPCAHEVSLNLSIAVCCMAVAAVAFVSFEFGLSLAYALHVQRSNCPVPICSNSIFFKKSRSGARIQFYRRFSTKDGCHFNHGP